MATTNNLVITGHALLFGSTQLTQFLAISPAAELQLATLNNLSITSHALLLTSTQLTQFLAISPAAELQLATLNNLSVTSHALLLTSTQLTQFLALPAPAQLQLATTNNLAITGHALLLGSTQLTQFLAIPPAAELQLATINNLSVTSHALQLNSTQLTSFLLLSSADQLMLASTINNLSITGFALQITASEQSAFINLPSDIQQQFVTINDVLLANYALGPTNSRTGLAFSQDELRIFSTYFLNLSSGAQAFLRQLMGPNLEYISQTPSPNKFGKDSFERTLASWNALNPSEQSNIIALGAGESIMNASTDFIQGLLAPLNSAQLALITETGMGNNLKELVGTPNGDAMLALLNSLNTAERAVVKRLDLSPQSFYSSPQVIAVVDAIASRTAPEQLLIDQLSLSHNMLYDPSGTTQNQAYFSAKITNALNFFNQLSGPQQIAARALGLNDLFYNFASTDTTAVTRAQTLTNYYLSSIPTDQQALQSTRLLADPSIPSTLDSSIASTLATYNALSLRSKTYLQNTISNDSAPFFYELANPPGSGARFRPLSNITTLLDALTSSEFDALLDLGITQAVVGNPSSPGPFTELLVGNGMGTGTPQVNLQAFIGFYSSLIPLQKNLLHELNILGNNNVSVLGADTDGITRLLTAYGALPGALIVATEQLDESSASNSPPFGDTTTPVTARSFFFSGQSGQSGQTILNVQFQSAGDLYVGASRYLKIDNTGLTTNAPAFTVGAGHDLYLHAADLIDLTGSPNNVIFSNGIRSITMAAATINLTNINFPEGSVASLNSKLGQTNFNNGYAPGKVNFINVTYGSSSQFTDSTTFTTATRGNIAIGTLTAPAAIPTYTP